MKFVDIVDIELTAGHGGAGAVSFHREKYVPKGGPNGGNGGKGGDIVLKVSDRVQTLLDIKFKRKYKAKAGSPGRYKNQYGANAPDLVMEVPVGTMVWDEDHNLIADLTVLGESLVVAKGGMGGKGNAMFATAINRAPRHAQPGMPGQEINISLELKMIAEVGLLGLPNAGKSTLLRVLTNAKAKIGAYPFTTLYPNLGVLHFTDSEIIIADIPGLIEGASEGHGLGIDFLRHISRTKVVVHLVSLEEPTFETCWENYTIILKELTASREEILSKPQIVVLTKTDLATEEEYKAIAKGFAKKKVECIGISAATLEGIDKLKSLIYPAVKGAK